MSNHTSVVTDPTPRIKVESSSIDPDHLRLVQKCAARIAPEGDHLREWVRSYVETHSSRFVHDLELLERYAAKDSKILEFGAVPLVLTTALKELGYKVKGVDIEPDRFASVLAEFDLEVARCDIETEPLPFASNTYDVALFNELFEHLRINPIFTLREVHRILCRGGVLLLSTPNLRSLSGIVNFLLRNRGYSCAAEIYEEYDKIEKLGHMGHVREYTTREVCAFLARLGFRVETLVFRGTYGNPLAKKIAQGLPKLRPFVSYIAIAEK